MSSSREHDGAVSNRSTWDLYYQDRLIDESAASTYDAIFHNPHLTKFSSGDLFELGCGGSHFLVRGAQLGWNIGGIDYNAEGVSILEDFLLRNNYETDQLQVGDIFDFDWDTIKNSVDVIASFGFLEHFLNAGELVRVSTTALRPGGIFVSQIPNLFSVNARLLKRYDRELWDQHVPYDCEAFDKIHTDAGLRICQPATYSGGFNQYMLTPWDSIEKTLPSVVYKVIRYFSSFVLQPTMSLLPENGHKNYCASIFGIYEKPQENDDKS